MSDVCLMFVTKSVTGYYTPQFLSQMKSDLHEIFSVLQDWSPEWIHNLLSGFIMRMQVWACMHSTWKRARNFGQKTNPYISSKLSRIFMKLGTMLEEVSRKHQKKFGTNTCMHAHATCVNVHACFYIWT